VLLLSEFPRDLRMTRWSSLSTTFRRSFVHHVRGRYEARIRFVEPFRFPAINPANFRRRVEEAFASGI
jgi:hypothetical protein